MSDKRRGPVFLASENGVAPAGDDASASEQARKAAERHLYDDVVTDPEGSERPFALATLSRRMVRPDLGLEPQRARRWATRLAILLTMSALAAVVLGPRLVDRELPTSDDVIGTQAQSHVTADRDYAIVDEEATRIMRQSARVASRSVWDLNLPQAQRDATALSTLLQGLTDTLHPQSAGDDDVFDPAAPAAKTDAPDVPAAKLVDDGKVEPLPTTTPEELARLRASFAGSLTMIGVEAPRDDAWGALVHAIRTEAQVASRLSGLVEQALSEPVVGQRDLLLREERGIVVRSLQVGAPAMEQVVLEPHELLDEDGAKAKLKDATKKALANLSDDDAEAVGLFLTPFVRVTLTFNAAETERRRNVAESRVPPQMVRVRRGETVVFKGEVLAPRHLLVLRAMDAQQGDAVRGRAAIGTGAFIVLLCAVIYLFGTRGVFRRDVQTKDLLFSSAVLLLLLLMLFAGEVSTPFVMSRFAPLPRSVVLYAIPVAWGGMQIRMVLTADAALLLSLVAAVLGGVMMEPGMQWTVVSLMASLAGIAGVHRITSRMSLLLAGFSAGLVGAGAAVTMELFRGTLVDEALVALGLATLAGGVLSGLLVVITTPLVEASFGYVTDLKLLSLADLNQPLLKELILNAPGTWHHSMRVGQLAERAATRIDANPLLARVMSLYHDVGKIRRPDCFRENQGRDNPHDRLTPEESVVILRDHVSIGVELAERYRIPDEVAAVISEHHADNRMDHFYARARMRDEDAVEADFRYSGRPPRSPESALVMLADQMEAASRSLAAPDAQNLRDIVDHFTNRAIVEATLSSCGITLSDIEKVRAAFFEGLCSMAGVDASGSTAPAAGDASANADGSATDDADPALTDAAAPHKDTA